MKNNKVIFFDMGNTLLHFHYGDSDHEKDMKGLNYLTKHLRKYDDNISVDEVKKEFFDKWMDGISLRKETLIEYPIEGFLNEYLKKHKIFLNLTKCIEAINIFYIEYKEQLHFEDDIYDTLLRIKEKGYKIGVISNTCYYDEVMIECFKHAKIYDLIDDFTFSYSLRIGKPQRAIFEKALYKMGVKASEAIMVGDNLKSDIRPASELGMKTVWLNSKWSENDSGIIPDYEIRNLKDITGYV